MTITSTPSEVSYAGDNVSTVFPIPFVFDTSADLKVIETDSAGNATVVTTGFSIAGGSGSTGTLTRLSALPAGKTLTILDNPAQTQDADYTDNDAFPAGTHEGALDRCVRISKRLFQLVQKGIRVDDGDPAAGSGMLLGSVTQRKGRYLFFNAITGAIEYAAGVALTTLSQSLIGQLLFPTSYLSGGASTAVIAAADAAALAAGQMLRLAPGTYVISSNTTLSAPILCEAGVSFQIATGATLTINGEFNAPKLSQMFTLAGTGQVVLSKTTNPEVWAHWFPGADIGAKINRAFAAAGGMGPVVIRICAGTYNYSTQINLLNAQGVRLTGAGSSQSTLSLGSPNLVWTGAAGSGSALVTPGARGVEIDHLGFSYSDATYNGNLLSFAKGAGTLDTSTVHVHHCNFLGDAGITLANALIELNVTEQVSIEHNSFRYAKNAIKATGASCNVVSIRHNWFQSDFTSAKISAQGNAWKVESNVFEDGASLIAAIELSGDLQGLEFNCNQCVDGGGGGGTLVDFHGAFVMHGANIGGNSFSAASGTAILFSSTLANTNGVNIRGNFFGAMAIGLNAASGENWVLEGNRMATVTQPYTAAAMLRARIGSNDLGTTANSGMSLADSTAQLLSRSDTRGSGLIEVYSVEDNSQALYFLNGAAHTVNEIIDPAAQYSGAAGTAASINIYWSAGNNRYEIENKRGATRTLVVNSFMGR